MFRIKPLPLVNIFLACLCAGFVQPVKAQSASQPSPLESFPLAAVRLLPGPFYQAQQTDKDYILALDPDRLLAPFQLAAGITPEAKRYPNWEDTGLDGHIGGHYLSALAYMYAATGEQVLLDRLTYMVQHLAQCQQKLGTGYVGGIPGGPAMWQKIAHGDIRAGNFSLNDKWVPLYNLHKLFAGLRDAYQVAGLAQAKDVLMGLADWWMTMTADLTDEQLQTLLISEHGGMNEVLADVAAMTGEEKYLTMAVRLSHHIILEPLLQHHDVLTGLHANTQIPKVIGFEAIGRMRGDTSWQQAAAFFWQTVVENRTVAIGGNSVREHFNPTDDFSSMITSNQGPETCNTYNMLRLTKDLFLVHPQRRYMDYYERALYNHILSSQHPEGGFVYFTPMRPRHYRVYSQPQQSFWCCVGSGLENHGKYGEMIYAHTDKDLYINLFIASTLQWPAQGLQLEQNTQFPYNASSVIKLTLQKARAFSIHIRYPAWVTAGTMTLTVNGKPQKLTIDPQGYITLHRRWKNGDVINITTPMHAELERLPADSTWGCFVYGPMVLAAATDTTDLKGLHADASRMGHVADGLWYPMEDAPMLVQPPNRSLASTLQPTGEASLTFTLPPNEIFPSRYNHLKLIPFFTLHDARYMIYWPLTTPAGMEAARQAMHAREEKLLALEARTIDQVAAGEQQPETEHHFQGEETTIGSTHGVSWRATTAWFSYELTNPAQQGITLQVEYGTGGDRQFDILLNDQPWQTVHLKPAQGQQHAIEALYELPPHALKPGQTNLTIKFVAHPNTTTGPVQAVRLLKAE